MAKILIAGNAVVLTSSVKLEDYKIIKKYRPDALTLYGGEDGKEPIFAVGIVDGSTGSINAYGAEFGEETRDGQGLATMTLTYPYVCGDVKEFVADQIGASVVMLGKLEATIPAVLESIAADKAEIMGCITVA